jgi:hypothetical protein
MRYAKARMKGFDVENAKLRGLDLNLKSSCCAPRGVPRRRRCNSAQCCGWQGGGRGGVSTGRHGTAVGMVLIRGIPRTASRQGIETRTSGWRLREALGASTDDDADVLMLFHDTLLVQLQQVYAK